MLKTQTPRNNQVSQPNQTLESDASNYLWDDFVKQIGTSTRRVDVTSNSKKSGEQTINKAWYNKASGWLQKP
jgi:hypothetical protein